MESPLLTKSAAFDDGILDMSDYLLDGVEESEKSIVDLRSFSVTTRQSSSELDFALAAPSVHSSSFIVQKKQQVRYSVEVCVKQVTRSGTSISANVAEGQYAQSNEDLIAKYGIALKEASETKMWLDRLLNRKVIDAKMHKSMNADLEELIKMLTSSINTLKTKFGK